MSLALRVVLLTLLAAVPVFLIQVTREVRLREDHVAEILDSARAYAGLAAARTDRFVEGARVLLVAASRLDSVRGGSRVECFNELARLQAVLPDFPAAAAFHPDGNTMCSSNPNPIGTNISDRTYFHETVSKKQFTVSDYVVGRSSGTGTIAFTYPALDDNGNVLAVLLLFINSAPLSELLNKPPVPAGGFIALVDSVGTITARWPDPTRWVGQKGAGTPWGEALLRNHDGAITARLADGADYALGFVPLTAPSRMSIVVGLPLGPAIRQAEAQFRRAMALTVAVFGLMALVAWLGAQWWVHRPVSDLREAADAIASGDLRARPRHTSSVPELRALGDHFVSMAQALEARLLQKDVLLKEVNHRVKNSLQLVASVFTLHRAGITDERARQQFDEVVNKIATVAHVHQKLYRDEKVDSIAFGAFIEEMCGELESVLCGDDQCTGSCEATECRLPTDLAIPLALIVNELITNAFKYAQPADGAGDIHVECRHDGAAVVVLVADRGPFPPDFKVADSKGLGMRMISVLLQQLRGSLEVVPLAHGKSFVVRVPT